MPSTIGIYGADTAKVKVQLSTKANPTTLYGVSKIFLENLGHYYKTCFGVDFRSMRYIGVISPKEYAYNGSTDYASEIFHKIKKNEKYSVCLTEKRRLPMAYMDDIINGTIQLIEAPKEKLTESVYNINVVDFSPREFIATIKKKYSEFDYEYKPDIRDIYASTWPYNYDDTKASEDFGWNPEYNTIEKIVDKMIEEVGIQRIMNH